MTVNILNPKGLLVAEGDMADQIVQLAEPAATPQQFAMDSAGPIQTWDNGGAILPDIGDVDAKLLALGGLSNTIVVSTTTAELLATITVSIGENGNWYVGDTDTGVAAEGTDPTKIIRMTGSHEQAPMSFVASTGLYSLLAGGQYVVYNGAVAGYVQFEIASLMQLTPAASTYALAIDSTGTFFEYDTEDLTTNIIPSTQAILATFRGTGIDRVMTPMPSVRDTLLGLQDTVLDLEDWVLRAEAAALAAEADAVQTAADRVQTGSDASATAADRVQTGQDAAATAADRVQTGLDAVATAQDAIDTDADRVQTGLDATATAADRVQTGLDRAATGQDAIDTGLDAAATAADRVQTGLDAASTAADVIAAATEADRAEAEANRAEIAADSVEGYLLTATQAGAIEAANKEKYAASGNVHSGKHLSAGPYTPVNEGLWTRSAEPNILAIGRPNGIGKSKTEFAVTNIAGSISNIITNEGASYYSSVLFPEAEDGTRSYNTVTGVSTQHVDAATAFAYADATADEEVVTERVDMFGWEQFKEEVTGAHIELFPGLIQNTSTTFGLTDVPTVLSTRKLSYFQVYDGQFPEVVADPNYVNDRYRCVVWGDLTQPQKRKVAAYLKERLYTNDDGNFVNTRIRQRTIAGAGNGDWDNVNSVDSEQRDITFQATLYAIRTTAQGDKDTPALPDSYRSRDVTWNTKPETGVFTATAGNQIDATCAYNGECYFMVMGTVSRLNQGAYHPSFNKSGTDLLDIGHRWWFTPDKVTSTYECFSRAHGSGDIGGASGRDDSRFYDAIYADGLGGVIDHRLSTWDRDTVEAEADVREQVKNGTYRGLEKLVKMERWGDNISFGGNIAIQVSAGTNIFVVGNHDTDIFYTQGGVMNFGDCLFKVHTGGQYTSSDYIDMRRIQYSDGTWFTTAADLIARSGLTRAGTSGNYDYFSNEGFIQQYEGTSVSGNFTMQDVLGDPANILLTPDLQNGWYGGWIPVIPNGTSQEQPLTRKLVNADGILDYAYTRDSGSMWTSSDVAITSVISNSHTTADPATQVSVWSYTASANQFVDSEVLPVAHGTQSLGPILTTADHQDATLSEGLLGIILKDTQGGYNLGTVRTGLLPDGKLEFVEHHTRAPAAPANGSKGMKMQSHGTVDNGQCSLLFQANEITYDAAPVVPGDEWGDTTLPTVVFNFSPHASLELSTEGTETYTDHNATVNRKVCKKLALPHGWAQQKAAAGSEYDDTVQAIPYSYSYYNPITSY